MSDFPPFPATSERASDRGTALNDDGLRHITNPDGNVIATNDQGDIMLADADGMRGGA